MSETLRRLEQQLAEAVAAEDFEIAALLRDEICKRQDASASKLREQVPGKMGLGTSREVYVRPEGWTPPKKPDLMTSRVKPGTRRRS